MSGSAVDLSSRKHYSKGLEARFEKRNFEKATVHFRRAAELGHIRAMICLGYSYFNGEGVERDKKCAFRLWQKAATYGNTHAEYLVGLCYEDGLGVSKQNENALYYYRRAGDRTHLQALNRLFFLKQKHYLEDAAIAVRRRNAFLAQMNSYWIQPQEASNLSGPLAFGLIYLTGYGVEKNVNYADSYFSSIADRMDPHLLSLIGVHLMRRNYDSIALEYLLMAIEKGSHSALDSLCRLYKRRGNFNELFDFLKDQAKKENTYAYRWLAKCYKYGWGTAVDDRLAHCYSSKALPKDEIKLKEYRLYPTEEAALEELQRAKEFIPLGFVCDERLAVTTLRNLCLKI